ncbi:hypothetical protein FHG87_019407 [Trinorchestia longiramus]|nr:hypothetical protein FHG87_019407 [Trinorchestia longiramus]
MLATHLRSVAVAPSSTYIIDYVSPSLSFALAHYFLPPEVMARRRDTLTTSSTTCPPPSMGLSSCTLRAVGVSAYIIDYVSPPCCILFLKVVRTVPLGALRKCKGAVGGYALNGGAYITV